MLIVLVSVTIGIGEYTGEEDLKFTLTATVTSGTDSKSVTFEYYIPGTPAKTSGPVFVEVPEVGGTYKYALEQAELGKTLYFTGAMNGNYLASSDNVLDAVDVTIEEVDGGVRHEGRHARHFGNHYKHTECSRCYRSGSKRRQP